MKYIMKSLPEVEVIELVENTIDPEGNKVAGRVVYINEYGAKGVKTFDQFFDKYRPLESEDILEKSLKSIDEMFENMSLEEFQKDLEEVRGSCPHGETIGEFLERTKDIPEDVKEEVEAVKLVVERARKENLGAGFSKQLRPAEIRYRMQQVRKEAIKEKK